MGFFDWLKRKLMRKKLEETNDFERFKALESKNQSLQSLDQSLQALEPSIESLEQRFKALQSLESASKSGENFPVVEKKGEKLEVSKDSLELGLAAGYAAKSLKEIEYALSRIESLMPSKEWMENKVLSELHEIKNGLNSHEKASLERFKALESALQRLNEMSKTLPEPLKEKFQEEIQKIEKNLPLTPKMEKLLEIVKEKGEISYEDLAKELGISISALRGLLTLTLRRTSNIERVRKNGKGWVKYADHSSFFSNNGV